jgi:ABC-type sugar transport systems, permease components
LVISKELGKGKSMNVNTNNYDNAYKSYSNSGGKTMNANIKKFISSGLILAGIAAMIFALYLDITGSKNTMRGNILIIGALLTILGVYSFPTRKHRMIINVLFLFPLLFAFLITVLIPFICGVFYSFTNWNGIKFTEFVGLGNYISMFKSEDYVYSFVVTFIFTVINMILVNQ